MARKNPEDAWRQAEEQGEARRVALSSREMDRVARATVRDVLSSHGVAADLATQLEAVKRNVGGVPANWGHRQRRYAMTAVGRYQQIFAPPVDWAFDEEEVVLARGTRAMRFGDADGRVHLDQLDFSRFPSFEEVLETTARRARWAENRFGERLRSLRICAMNAPECSACVGPGGEVLKWRLRTEFAPETAAPPVRVPPSGTLAAQEAAERAGLPWPGRPSPSLHDPEEEAGA